MSKYTTEVRYICETTAGYDESVGYNSIDDVLDKCWEKVFSFNFPIFNEDYRKTICTKILKHYYTREIGFETVGRWKLELDIKMNEIMPYYNKMYESELLEFDPLKDVDTSVKYDGLGSVKQSGTETNKRTYTHGTTDTETRAGTDNHTTSQQTDAENEHITAYSETPQGTLANTDIYANNSYLTTATRVVDKEDMGEIKELTQYGTTFTNTHKGTDTDENKLSFNGRSTDNANSYLIKTTGKTASKSYSSLLKEFRETFLNIDMMIIDELKDLFMQVW